MTIRSDIRSGDKFDFVGIGDAPEGSERTILILGCSVSGTLSGMLTIRFRDAGGVMNENAEQFSIPYSEALVLLEQDIWKEPK